MRKHLKRTGLIALVTSALVVGVIAGLKVANYYSTPRALNVQTASASGPVRTPVRTAAPAPAVDTSPTTAPDTTSTAPAPDPTTTVAPPPPSDPTTTVAPPPPPTDVTTTTEFVPPPVPTCTSDQVAVLQQIMDPQTHEPIVLIDGDRYVTGTFQCIYQG